MNTPLVVSPREQLSVLLAAYPECSFLGRPDESGIWDWIAAPLRSSFTSQLAGLLTGWNTTQDMTSLLRGVNALGWEIECFRQALEDGESMGSQAKKLEIRSPAKCARYEDKQPLEEGPRSVADKVKIQNDVPLLRETRHGLLPYVVEAKYSQLRPYGQAYGFGKSAKEWIRSDALNQLLRYQFAIDQGKIAGATLELKGGVHPRMLDWMLDGLDGQGSRIPSVEVVWSLPLPSGAYARVWLKRGEGQGRLSQERVVLASDAPALEAFIALREDRASLREFLRGEISPDWPQLPEPLLAPRLNPFGNSVCVAFEPWVITDVESFRLFLKAQHQWLATGGSAFVLPAPPVQEKRSPRCP